MTEYDDGKVICTGREIVVHMNYFHRYQGVAK
jgi:hypothetical protein